MHQQLGHEVLRGGNIKTQEDFFVLAKAYGRVGEKEVTIFAEYDKMTDNTSNYVRNNKSDYGDEDSYSNSGYGSDQTREEVRVGGEEERGLSGEQEKIRFNNQLIAMVKQIYGSITGFKEEMKGRIDTLFSQFGEGDKENFHPKQGKSQKEGIKNEYLKVDDVEDEQIDEY
jgi:hypothetical protein